MTDQRFTELLGKQLAGEISADESLELKSILVNNAAFSKEYHLLQSYLQSETEEEGNIDVVFNRIKSQIHVPAEPVLKVIKTSNRIWLKIATAAAVILIGILVYRGDLFISNKEDGALTKVQTRAAEMKTITLADGSTVKINSASQLSYPVKFNGAMRNVYLSGEAFFEVKKDPQHPFIVHTKKTEVKVLGTAFDVKAYPNDAAEETTLIRGKVLISLKDDTKQHFNLKPNDKFVLSDGKVAMSKVNDPLGEEAMETAWMNHQLIYKNNRFDEIARRFERWYGVKIVFKDPELKAITFTGLVDQEPLNEALDVLKLIENFNYSIKGKNVYIYR
ncbi:DUF4974 domain-containing protein [Agrobacterium tumefaciens]|nr:DUF4974 domain-containing protein [Agrobacterium tumefaciens]NTE21424.1 DUF4974 domain-containing protein [Agrobacterium tumefaciens]